MPTEAILRSMYYTGKIERQYGLSFPLVMANENQTQPYGLGMLWAGSGARYSWKGVCNCDARKLSRLYGGTRRYEIYWWTGSDGSKILLKWNSLDGYYSIGGYAEVSDPVHRGGGHYVDTNSTFTFTFSRITLSAHLARAATI